MYMLYVMVNAALAACGPDFKANAGVPYFHNHPLKSAEERNLISFGHDVQSEEYPWLVRLEFECPKKRELEGSSSSSQCSAFGSGSLISEFHILTAAHNVENRTISKVEIIGIDVGKVKKVWIHDDYKGLDNGDHLVKEIYSHFSDIAIIELSKSVCTYYKKFRPVALPAKIENFQYFPQCSVWIVGFGMVLGNKGVYKPSVAQEAQQRIEPKCESMKLYLQTYYDAKTNQWNTTHEGIGQLDTTPEILSDKFNPAKVNCVSDQTSINKVIGGGDSGGPVLMNIKNSTHTRYVQIGVHKGRWVDATVKNLPMLSFSTSTIGYVDYIKSKTSKDLPTFICLPGCDMQHYKNFAPFENGANLPPIVKAQYKEDSRTKKNQNFNNTYEKFNFKCASELSEDITPIYF